ncbi:hypothetical protein [Ferrimonas balearica]|uniref:hypothetical protein n=1 Tax=Ferrimonas balearica TaxID=44012 RepID=UPI001F47136F|nr:hypothetical protein [Ferrimonas balearica]MBY6093438.1 hypothetical protein [Ferrimonas balearica]
MYYLSDRASRTYDGLYTDRTIAEHLADHMNSVWQGANFQVYESHRPTTDSEVKDLAWHGDPEGTARLESLYDRVDDTP